MKSIREILKVYNSSYISSKKLKFTEVNKQDVYNITSPFQLGRKKYLLGRVEPRLIESTSQVMLFKKKNSQYWEPEKKFLPFNLQDPFIIKIAGQIILGGVEIVQRPTRRYLSYRTVFYKGQSINNLKLFATGPWGMKGIRLIELPNKTIGVFTRPQGEKGRRGKIGFAILDSINELSKRKLTQAPLIENKFTKGEWGGVNQLLVLKNNKIGILGHIARFSKDGKNRFYYPISFCFDQNSGKVSPLRILLRRAELPEGEAKRPDLYNVVYPGGIDREKNGMAKLYAGIGDAESFEIKIKDPFIYYEENF
jgi:hypothetical protein